MKTTGQTQTQPTDEMVARYAAHQGEVKILTAPQGDRIMADLLAPFTPEACERETVRAMNRQAPRCSKGHATVYSHAVGACRCEFGALVKLNGLEVQGC